MASRPRILIASPYRAETSLVADWVVAEGFEPVPVTTAARAAEHIKDQPLDLFMSDFTLGFRSTPQLVALLRARSARTPIIALGDADPAAEAQAEVRGATFVARPLERASLVCTVSLAILETRPVRRSARKPVNRLEATVQGMLSHIVDISKEGLRIEVPRSRKSVPLGPQFSVRVPILGVTVGVRRMWTCSAPNPDREAAWYGGELIGNSRVVEQAWRVLVDTIPTAGTALEVV